jgi:hypothetical protein
MSALREAHRSVVDGAAMPRCADCIHRLDDRRAIEQKISGLAVLGSAYGASIAASRLCLVHECLVSPEDRCAHFTGKA